MTIFNNATPEQLGAMRADAVRLGKTESFDAAVAAEGLTIATPEAVQANAFEELQHSRHGVAYNVPPERYSFQWKGAADMTVENDREARAFFAGTKMTPGYAASLVSRVEEVGPELAKLSDQDRAERVAKAKACLGEANYDTMLATARDVLKSGSAEAPKFGLLKSIEGIATADVWTLRMLSGFGGTKAALAQKIAAKGTGK